MPADTPVSAPSAPSFAPRLYSIALVVAMIVISGALLVARFTALDYARDLQTWQEKLNLIAESRTADINQWIGDHFKELRTLADNPSMQLYLTELQTMPSAESEKPGAKLSGQAEPAQKAYLRNLLLFTAGRAGFSAGGNAPAIPANVQPESKNGMAVLNNNDEIVVSTAMLPATRDTILANAKKLPAAQEGLIDLSKDSEGAAYIGFIVPIYSIQGDHNAASQIGRVIGIKTVNGNLFGLLKHPGVTEKTLEALLVRNTNGQLDYISPLQDGSNALSKEGPRQQKSAEAALVETPGSFVADQKDYRNKPVLATSRAIANTPWMLIVKIDRSEALAESDARRSSMVVVFFLIIAIIVLIIVAIWWHAYSRRAMMMSRHFRSMATQAVAQERLLRLVADNQPEPIYIVDKELAYRFANRKTAEDARMSADSVLGKTLADVRGTVRAEQVKELCEQVLAQRDIVYNVQRVQQDGEEKIIRSAYVPLDEIPVINLPERTPGVLIVEQDISEVMHEREQRLGTLNQLVQTLVRLVDKRDPFAANHSILVAQLARAVAGDMELDDITVETTRTAGSLMNIGKILVPAELLTKTGALNAEEKRMIRDSMNAAADLVKGISFDGPVAETLQQWQEKWDGSGQLGLKGEHILIPARIIAVANAYIGMISPRSWRTALPAESANKFLLDQSGTLFDRRVVIALIHYTETQAGREWLSAILSSHQDAA